MSCRRGGGAGDGGSGGLFYTGGAPPHPPPCIPAIFFFFAPSPHLHCVLRADRKGKGAEHIEALGGALVQH